MVPVRIRGSIGQLEQEITGSCPNAGLNRTASSGIGWFLSEWRAQSDSLNEKSPVLVRMAGSIGQLKQEIAGSCLNGGLNRTARSRNRWFLSEYGAQSDSLNKKSMVLVRILGSIGQLEQEIDGSCPKTRLNRTAHSRNRWFLSECRVQSDSLIKKSTVPVRMPGSIGQNCSVMLFIPDIYLLK